MISMTDLTCTILSVETVAVLLTRSNRHGVGPGGTYYAGGNASAEGIATGWEA